MNTWRRFRALPPGDRALILEAAVLLIVIRTAISLIPFALFRRGLCRLPRPRSRSASAATASASRIAWAIRTAAIHLPLRTTCLVDALAAEAMLVRRDVACQLRFGVRPRPDGTGALAAHSWIEHDGLVLLGAVENLADYRVLSSPGAR